MNKTQEGVGLPKRYAGYIHEDSYTVRIRGKKATGSNSRRLAGRAASICQRDRSKQRTQNVTDKQRTRSYAFPGWNASTSVLLGFDQICEDRLFKLDK